MANDSCIMTLILKSSGIVRHFLVMSSFPLYDASCLTACLLDERFCLFGRTWSELRLNWMSWVRDATLSLSHHRTIMFVTTVTLSFCIHVVQWRRVGKAARYCAAAASLAAVSYLSRITHRMIWRKIPLQVVKSWFEAKLLDWDASWT